MTASTATPNLLIVKGGVVGTPVTTGGKTSEEITSTNTTPLYPASTKDCSVWWAVSEWRSEGTDTKASKYYQPAISQTANSENVKNGQYTQGSSTLNAYQVSTYSVYTTTGEVDLNLDPVNPISVTVKTAGTNHSTGTGFKDSMRIGIVVDGTLKVVYAPTAVTGAGNDLNATSGWAQVKDDSNTEAATYNHVEGNTFDGWTAVAGTGGVYTKATNSLGTVTTTGAVVQIYVWIEGTDADCIVTRADSGADDNVYQVALNFVGATVENS